MKEINIPFAGFYETRWSDGIDQAEEQQAEHFAGEKDMDEGTVAEVMFHCMNYPAAFKHVARKFVEYYQDHLTELLGFKVKLTFSSLDSPREYNFATDRIFVQVSDRAVRRIFQRVDHARLTEVAAERHTSYSGFHSFYDPDWQSWGPVSTWDLNQLGTLVRALETDPEWEWGLYDTMNEANVFGEAVDEALDFPKFEGKLEERRLIEAGEIEPDGRLFPYGESDPAKYCDQFQNLNHLRKS